MNRYPQTVEEAERRFYAMFTAHDPYARPASWSAVESLCREWFLPTPPKPTTIEEWIAVGRRVRSLLEWVDGIPPGTPITEEMLRQRPGA